MNETRECSWCGRMVRKYSRWCPHCTKAIEERPSRERMTPRGRLDEYEGLCRPLEVPLHLAHWRIEILAGRAIQTSEFVWNLGGIIESIKAKDPEEKQA